MIDIATPGTEVSGTYAGVPFRGTVNPSSRYHTMNPGVVVIYVDLAEPIVVGGLERFAVCCEVGFDGGHYEGFDLATVRVVVEQS